MRNDRDYLVEVFDRADLEPIILEDGAVVLAQGRGAVVFKFTDEGELVSVDVKESLSDNDLEHLEWVRRGD